MPRFLVECDGIERAIDAASVRTDYAGALVCIGLSAATVAIFAPGRWRKVEMLPPREGEPHGNAPGADAQLP